MSFWHLDEPCLPSDSAADVVILGGGIAGLSTAYWLTEMRPELRITVVDRGTIGAGASGRNAGFLTTGSAAFYAGLCRRWGPDRAREIFTFARQSLELLQEHVLKASPHIHAERSFSQTLVSSDAQLTAWGEAGLDPRAFNLNWREGASLPRPIGHRFIGAYESGPEFKVNPIQLLGVLRGILESRRVQIVEKTSAYHLGPAGLQTDVNLIQAKSVVLALNGYLPQFHPTFSRVITARRAQMLAVELQEDLECPGLYYDPPERVYWRLAQKRVLLIGGKRLVDEAGETGDFEKLSPVIQGALEDYLRGNLGLSFRVLRRWSGIMGFTESELPIIERLETPLPTVVVGGFSGHGMGLGFHAGREAAALVTGEKTVSFFGPIKHPEIAL